MKWVFGSVETIQPNKILKVELEIGNLLYTVKFVKGVGVIELYEFKSKRYNSSPGHIASQAMVY